MDISNQNNQSNPSGFIPGEVFLDPMSQTDDDITETLEDSQTQQINLNGDETGNSITTEALDDSNESEEDDSTEENVENGETNEGDQQEGQEQQEENQDPGLDDFSQAALTVKLFEENGLAIYNELNKDLTFEDLAKDIPEYINQAAQAIADQKLQKYDQYAEYIKLIADEGIPKEVLDPAIEVQNIASFDIDDPSVTEDQLFDLVKKMHLRRNLNPNEAEALATVSKANKTLEEDARKSIEFHDNYATRIKTEAIRQHQEQVGRRQAAEKQAYTSFVEKVSSGKVANIDVSKADQKNIIDTVYSKDQLVKWTDDNGDQQQSYVSKYELGMYQASQDPEKLALIAYIIANDFSLAPIKQQAKTSLSKDIVDRLNNKSGSSKNVKVKNTRKEYQDMMEAQKNKQASSMFPSMEFEL